MTTNNLPKLQSLVNLVKNNDKIQFHALGVVDAKYFIPKAEELAKIKETTRLVELRCAYYVLTMNIPCSKKSAFETVLKGAGFTCADGFTTYDEDKGLIFMISDNMTTKKVVQPEQYMKQPWFDDLLAFMIERDPSFSEEKLMDIKKNNFGTLLSYNTTAIKQVVPKCTITVEEVDKEVAILKIRIMNDEISAHEGIINSVIGVLGAL